MKKCLFAILSILICFSCKSQKKVFQSEKLEKKWELNGLVVPECIAYDENNNILFVSNIGSKSPGLEDGKGFISKISLDGKIINLKWVEGLNAPKGMTVFHNYLYVADINKLVQIDIELGIIVQSIPVREALFINDVVADNLGFIYATDTKSKLIYKFMENSYKVLSSDSSFLGPNGIIVDNDFLIAGAGNKLVKINPNSGDVNDLILNTGQVDGLAKLDDTTYLISEWKGKIYLAFTNKEKELILDTSPIENMKTADFYYHPELQQIFIPTFFNNSVVCYQFKN